MDVDSTAAVVVYFHCSGNMNISNAVDSLAALAQETRLNIFRLLVRNAPQGVPAGTIARRLKLPGPTLSFHLNALAATELIKPHKNGRSISYSANFDNINRLIGFLMENCCGGRGCDGDGNGKKFRRGK
jgi:ArsR family transcriptional regulator, arsenate/arsenite/antimonite-responsive transcriptional repressor